MLKSIDRRLAAIESRQPPPESKWEAILRRCTDEELDRLQFVERTENPDEFTDAEKDFLDDLVSRYAPD